MKWPHLDHNIRDLSQRVSAFVYNPKVTRTQVKGLLKIYGIPYQRMQSTLHLRQLLADYLQKILKTANRSLFTSLRKGFMNILFMQQFIIPLDWFLRTDPPGYIYMYIAFLLSVLPITKVFSVLVNHYGLERPRAQRILKESQIYVDTLGKRSPVSRQVYTEWKDACRRQRSRTNCLSYHKRHGEHTQKCGWDEKAQSCFIPPIDYLMSKPDREFSEDELEFLDINTKCSKLFPGFDCLDDPDCKEVEYKCVPLKIPQRYQSRVNKKYKSPHSLSTHEDSD